MYLLSKAIFDCCTWPCLTNHEAKNIHSHVMRLYRTLIPTSYDNPDIDFLVTHVLLPPVALVSLSRLILFSRLLVTGKVHILALLYSAKNRPKAWLNAILDDFKFLSCTPKIENSKTWNMSQWANYIIQYPKTFRASVRDMMLTPYSLLHYVLSHIIYSNEVSTVISPQPFSCTLWEYQSPTMQQLNLHMFKSHKWIHPSQYVVDADSTICPICLMQFHTRVRFIEHLRYTGQKRRCLENVYIVKDVINSDVVSEILARDAALSQTLSRSGFRGTKAQAPAYRVSGPLRPSMTLARHSPK